LLISLGIGTWAFGSSSGGYEQVDKLASIKCLGCLGLDPVVPGFSEFWIEYPEDHVKEGQEVDHPQEVIDILDDEDVDLFILFFCDAADDPVGYYTTYVAPTGLENGVPMTTFIFRDNDGVIKWYSHYGRMELEAVDSLITHVLYHEISSAH
jgi:hypothetical protein